MSEQAAEVAAAPLTPVAATVPQPSFADILKQLGAPFPPEELKQRVGWTNRQTGQQNMVDYVEWHTVTDRLDKVCPTWESHIRRVEFLGQTLVVTVALTIEGVTREGMGTGAAGSDMTLKKAEHDALKRAAVKFGVARDLYKKDEEHAPEVQQPAYQQGVQQNWQAPQQQQQYSGPPPQQQGYQQQQGQQQYPPFDMTGRFLATPAQMNALQNMAGKLGASLEQLITEKFGPNAGTSYQLSKAGASIMFTELQGRINSDMNQAPPQQNFAPPMNQPPANPGPVHTGGPTDDIPF
jgi:hypothetical protein